MLRIITAVSIAGLAVQWSFDHVLATTVNGQRQLHLSGSLRAPKPSVIPGDAVMVLQVPKIALNEVVIEGVTVDHLRSGPARLGDGAMPGEAGTMVLLGHRAGYGAPFARLAELAPGDDVVVQARNGPIVRYRVTELLRDSRLENVPMVGDDMAQLLLVTSEPGTMNTAQLVLVATSDPVNDAEVRRPDLAGAAFDRQPLGVDALLFNVAALGSAMCWIFLRTRVASVVAACLTAPVAITALVYFMLMLDSVRPLTR